MSLRGCEIQRSKAQRFQVILETPVPHEPYAYQFVGNMCLRPFDTVKVAGRVQSCLLSFIRSPLIMSNHSIPQAPVAAGSSTLNEPNELNESFGEMLSQYEKSHSRKADDGGKQLVGSVIVVTGDSIFLDIGFKSEGILPLAVLQANESVKPGDKLTVSVKG